MTGTHSLRSKRNDSYSLLSIVKTWKVNPKPEYRGFRCADCQKYIRKAWHHFLDYGGYKVPVHFCNACQKKLGSKEPKFKSFTCDKCKKNIFKAFHIWMKKGNILVENHYCKKC